MEMIEVQAFVVAVHSGTFTRAAATLHISQPAVSRRIELLEQEVGAPLFERLHSGVRLTPAGEAFLPYARRVLAAANDGLAAVQEVTTGKSGTVSLAIVGSLAGTHLTERVLAFRRSHPDVKLVLTTALSAEVSELVQQGDATIGIRYFSDTSPNLVSVPLYDEDLVVTCSAQSALADQSPSRPVDLTGIPWLAFPTGTRSSGEPFARVLQRQLFSTDLDGAEVVSIDSLTAQKRLIEAGFGIGLLPVSSITEEVRLGTLHVLPIPELSTSVPVVAVHRREAYLGPAALDLLGILKGADQITSEAH